jgi:hypothetical protein
MTTPLRPTTSLLLALLLNSCGSSSAAYAPLATSDGSAPGDAAGEASASADALPDSGPVGHPGAGGSGAAGQSAAGGSSSGDARPPDAAGGSSPADAGGEATAAVDAEAGSEAGSDGPDAAEAGAQCSTDSVALEFVLDLSSNAQKQASQAWQRANPEVNHYLSIACPAGTIQLGTDLTVPAGTSTGGCPPWGTSSWGAPTFSALPVNCTVPAAIDSSVAWTQSWLPSHPSRPALVLFLMSDASVQCSMTASIQRSVRAGIPVFVIVVRDLPSGGGSPTFSPGFDAVADLGGTGSAYKIGLRGNFDPGGDSVGAAIADIVRRVQCGI